jgi:hypothetical protein
MRSWVVRSVVMMVFAWVAPASAADPFDSCPDCQFLSGIGGTYHFWGRTGSLAVPFTLTLDQDRWEVAAIRFTSPQQFFDDTLHYELRVANPYWGFSASRRFEFFRYRYWRMLIGAGGSYKTEADIASASHWNFAEQLGLRITPVEGAAIELVVRHWSDAGLKLPNHGQDFATLSFTVYPGFFGRPVAATE